MSGIGGPVQDGQRSLGLPSAKVYRPTAAEWADPLRYISSISKEAQACGIAKIVPPEGWAPPFAINKAAFKFSSKIQAVHELQDRLALQARREFAEELQRCMVQEGKAMKRPPVFGGKEVDLYKLWRAVYKRGGYGAVTEDKKWKDIVRILQLPSGNNNASYSLRQIFQKYLLPYEEYEAERLRREMDAAAADDKDGSPAAAAPAAAAAAAPAAAAAADKRGRSPDAEEPPAKKQRKPKAERGESEEPTAGGSQPPSRPKKPPPGTLRIPKNIDVLLCEACNGGHHEDQILLCDGCDRGFHMFCLNPPLEKIPAGDWLCPICLQARSDNSALRQGTEMSWAEFEKSANAAKRMYWGGDARARKATWDQVETEFWRVVEEAEEPFDVLVGDDLDTAVLGSGFPCSQTLLSQRGIKPLAALTARRQQQQQHGGSGGGGAQEQQRQQSKQPGGGGKAAAGAATAAAVAATGGSSGVPAAPLPPPSPQSLLVPKLSLGSMFSSSCWGVTDHLLYGVHYMHMGEPRRWYSVPAEEGKRYEDAVRALLPGQLESQPELLDTLGVMLHPRSLKAAGVAVYGTLQEPGQFVVTFPSATTAHVNTGFNVVESVLAAPPDWWQWTEIAAARLRNSRRVPVFSQDRLMLAAASSPVLSRAVAGSLLPQLLRLTRREEILRLQLWSAGVHKSRVIGVSRGMAAGDSQDAECATCRAPLHTLALECDCCPGRFVCPHHAAALCECGPAEWRLRFRFTLAQLKERLADAAARVGMSIAELEQEEEQQRASAAEANDAATVAAAEAEVDADSPLVFEHYFDVLSSSSSDDDDSNEDLGFSSSGDDGDDAAGSASSASGESEPEQEQKVAEQQQQQVDSSSGSSDDEDGKQQQQQQQQSADKRSCHSSDGGGESSSAGDASGDEAAAAAADAARRRTSQRARKPSVKLLQVVQDGEEKEAAPADAAGVRSGDLPASSGKRRGSATGGHNNEHNVSNRPPLSRKEQRERRRKRREQRRRRQRREQRMAEAQQQGLDSAFPKELEKMRRKLLRKRQGWEAAAGGLLAAGGAAPEQVAGLLVRGEQHLWGGSECDGARALYSRLQEAQQWAAQVERAARARPSTPYELVAKLLSLQPPPMAVEGLDELKEAAAAAAAWRANGSSSDSGSSMADLMEAALAEPPSAAAAAAAAASAAAFAGKRFDVQMLQDLADEVADVGLELPELALLRARLAQGEGLQEQLDEALGAEGEERASIASLKALQQQASSCGLALSGLDRLAASVEQAEAMQAHF
ncbi:hypothetical protein OEZ85_013288 [Tetradesmus obliquus]|uniref:[Histone H3]-trimethyl-L-lysine(4) demethylase n=1 Tax=Tetradesmus obliquus TaxID=3088 RepID=A0ABY8UAD1_TETOB|nr:hypothetical protein OEZ85_013288 [Tetradesmus obliquus]